MGVFFQKNNFNFKYIPTSNLRSDDPKIKKVKK